LPTSRTKLKEVVAGMPAVRVWDVALAGEAGARPLHVAGGSDSSSLLPIGPRQTQLFPGTGEIGTVEVRSARLDELMSVSDLVRPVLLKLDVQGYELEAVKGAAGLMSSVDAVITECSFCELYPGQALADEVVAYFLGLGFRMRGVFSLVCDRAGRSVQADLLFSREAQE